MSNNRPAVRLSPERYAQVKAIANALGDLTMSEAVGHMVNREIKEGTIPAGLEGIAVQHVSDGVTIAFDEHPPVLLSKDGAADLAEKLFEFAHPQKRAQKVANMQHDYLIQRKGNGVMLNVPLAGKITKSFPRDIAYDLGRLLSAA